MRLIIVLSFSVVMPGLVQSVIEYWVSLYNCYALIVYVLGLTAMYGWMMWRKCQ